jgi:hypothetical protein
MVRKKREWHSPRKIIVKPKKGRCPLCHVAYKNLDAHIKAKHKGKRIVKRR